MDGPRATRDQDGPGPRVSQASRHEVGTSGGHPGGGGKLDAAGMTGRRSGKLTTPRPCNAQHSMLAARSEGAPAGPASQQRGACQVQLLGRVD